MVCKHGFDSRGGFSLKPKAMIKVFFETDGYANEVARFDDERTYIACLPALELECKRLNFEYITEVVTDDPFDTMGYYSPKVYNFKKKKP
jgi:hypothetical protein